MVIQMWVIIAIILIVAFPVSQSMFGKNLKLCDDYVPVLSEICCYITGVLCTIVLLAIIFGLCWAFYFIGSCLWQIEWINFFTHEVLYIK